MESCDNIDTFAWYEISIVCEWLKIDILTEKKENVPFKYYSHKIQVSEVDYYISTAGDITIGLLTVFLEFFSIQTSEPDVTVGVAALKFIVMV